jgi:penicillin-binding protein 2
MKIYSDLGALKRRSRAIILVVALALGLIHVRLAQLQIVERSEWRQLALNNRLRRIPVPASRGRIFDRTGRVLAENLPAWQLYVFPDEIEEMDETLCFLAERGVADVDELGGRFQARRTGTMAPLVAADNLSWEQVAGIRVHQSDFPELSVVSGFRRSYPAGPTAAHAIGYLRRISPDEASTASDGRPDRLVGAFGVEAVAEQVLRGIDGERWIVASAVGRQLGMVRETEPVPGNDVSTTLDLRLQEAVVDALANRAGAVVALDVHSGAVRALYSSPSFEPELFNAPLTETAWRSLSENPDHPLQNRCVQGTYPPGSTIKPFLVLAGLEHGVISPYWRVFCSGSVRLHGHTFRCWNRGGHGSVDLARSLEVSCDVYYYMLGQKLGIETMAAAMTSWGLGSKTGIDLTHESAGLVGDPEWSRRVRGTPWYPGESVSVSIGQGPVLVTTLQLARAYAALANGGRLVRPHLLPSGNLEEPPRIALEPAAWKLVVEGLRRVVAASQGTARSLSDLPVAGKTGTAQVVRLPEDGENRKLEGRLQHHAWFVGWAPVDDPRIAVAVLVEHGGGGGAVAAPTARKVFETALDTEGHLLADAF